MKRVTIMIDADVDKKIRRHQAAVINKKNISYSYSRCVNDLLRGRK